MKKNVFRIESDGFNGAWYPAPVQSNRGLSRDVGSGIWRYGRCHDSYFERAENFEKIRNEVAM